QAVDVPARVKFERRGPVGPTDEALELLGLRTVADLRARLGRPAARSVRLGLECPGLLARELDLDDGVLVLARLDGADRDRLLLELEPLAGELDLDLLRGQVSVVFDVDADLVPLARVGSVERRGVEV